MAFISPQLKYKLEKIKREIDKTPNWGFFVKNQFEYEKISKFDNKKRASRAFYKIMEIHKKWEIVTPQTKKILCLCEAPGGFIQAFQEIGEFEIHAQSLPGSITFNNSINGDIYKYNDICKLETILEYTRDSKKFGKYDLVTGDGGIDVSDDYSQQEKKSMKIIYCQILTMLYCLREGGNFVLKIFDCFRKETIQLLQLLSNHFNKFQIEKPVLSRPCNSEKYVICLGFKGYKNIIPGFSSQLMSDVMNFNIPITLEFHNQIIQMNKSFVTNQIKSIKEILDICNGKYNSKNIDSKRTQIRKSMAMYKTLDIN